MSVVLSHFILQFTVEYSVDDVVVGKADGTLICCQCKKNQIDFKAWTIADLADELEKASSLLTSNETAEVRFYSRSPFGALAKLREHSTTQPNEANYLKSLSHGHKKTDVDLAARLADHAPNLSNYEFLRRTSFEISPELNRMEILLRERLSRLVSNAGVAYNALWTRLDHLGARIDGNNASVSTLHRLTKNDLKEVLVQSGAMLVQPMNLMEVRASFADTSSIGRSWHRNIAKQKIPRPVLNELLEAIYAGKQAILLTGMPGSGKTCVMLALQESLEQRAQTRADIVPLFIQSREFAELATAQDRQAQGLPEQWVEKAARVAEESHVVVVIDSLDVLSIAREDRVLTYFLAQIDRLLLIPNITVITACRDFDRVYDRRIAQRKWDFERKCLPLDWESEILPLLDILGIQVSTLDSATHEIIRNPRELALFVELAQREGSFNVVTSQALAQRYLVTIVQNDSTLGETAIQAIESIANKMLISRRLKVPQQLFTASQDIQRMLCSLNVLQKNQEGYLAFGHQTLLDVLVVSRAVRQGLTLNQFIQSLSPVPFVRPSIRSFIAHLAMGDRLEFRKQLRTVLTGGAPFHIRRLVAESLAGQKPQDGDWSLIRDLRDNYREVFQVIYAEGQLIQWHYFWLTYLVPLLIDVKDTEGITTHAYRVAQWRNTDVAGVLAFWTDVLQLKWIDNKQIAKQIANYLCDINIENLTLAVPLLEYLLCMPQLEHCSLGRAVFRCVAAGAMEDHWLWRYIAGDIEEGDALEFRLNDKLHCGPHEFGEPSDIFLLQRMEQSTALLDLALESVERWSQIKTSYLFHPNKRHYGVFLSETSYENTHSKNDNEQKDSLEILLNSLENAVCHHARKCSDWWRTNRERLCFSHEEALRYFAILACTNNPNVNIGLIGRMLCDKDLLESDLSYELGTLIYAAYRSMTTTAQDAAMECILTLHQRPIMNESEHFWILQKRAELVVAIPCYLRSPEAQSILDDYEKKQGTLFRQPRITSYCGTVVPPFSFEVFLSLSDSGVLRLLTHYVGHKRDSEEIFVGGGEAVGNQLCEASSRDPARFMFLLSSNWIEIDDGFRDEIMSGSARYLSCRYGNLQINDAWSPINEPDASQLASYILDLLENHTDHWHHSRVAADALQACSHVIKDPHNADRLVSLVMEYKKLPDESIIQGESNLITKGINMTIGRVTEALMILANNFLEHDIPFPESLPPALVHFAGSDHLAVRALILRHLPFFQYKDPALGWELFNYSMQASTGLWECAERCLYHSYSRHFELVSPLLERNRREGSGKDLETWGRISALAALSCHLQISDLLKDLNAVNSSDAWRGATKVWINEENVIRQQDACFAGIKAGLSTDNPHSAVVAELVKHLFSERGLTISIPFEIINRLLVVMKRGWRESKRRNIRIW